MLGVGERNGFPDDTGFLTEPIDGPIDRGGIFGFVSWGFVDDVRELTEGCGLKA